MHMCMSVRAPVLVRFCICVRVCVRVRVRVLELLRSLSQVSLAQQRFLLPTPLQPRRSWPLFAPVLWQICVSPQARRSSIRSSHRCFPFVSSHQMHGSMIRQCGSPTDRKPHPCTKAPAARPQPPPATAAMSPYRGQTEPSRRTNGPPLLPPPPLLLLAWLLQTLSSGSSSGCATLKPVLLVLSVTLMKGMLRAWGWRGPAAQAQAGRR